MFCLAGQGDIQRVYMTNIHSCQSTINSVTIYIFMYFVCTNSYQIAPIYVKCDVNEGAKHVMWQNFMDNVYTSCVSINRRLYLQKSLLDGHNILYLNRKM